MDPSPAPPELSEALRDAVQAHRGALWGLCYRMTGVAADADEIVQETCLRALERPPSLDRPLRPWLVRVAMNLARDRLRRRRRQRYVGPWLPSPVERDLALDALLAAPDADAPPTSEARYAARESASYAFALALEALTPNQRAVLLLRDVLDYSAAETSAALEISVPNVKTTLHRARKAMRARDDARQPMTPARQERTLALFQQFLGCVAAGDHAAAAALLTPDAVALTDGGGVYSAARIPILGAARVARFFVNLGSRQPPETMRFALCQLNGEPALLLEIDAPPKNTAPRMIVRIELDGAGQICEIHSVLAPDKLTGVTFGGEQAG